MSQVVGHTHLVLSPENYPKAFVSDTQAREFVEYQYAAKRRSEGKRFEDGMRWVSEGQGRHAYVHPDGRHTEWVVYHLDIVDEDAVDDWDDDRGCEAVDQFAGGTIECHLDLNHRGLHQAFATVDSHSVTVTWGEEGRTDD